MSQTHRVHRLLAAGRRCFGRVLVVLLVTVLGCGAFGAAPARAQDKKEKAAAPAKATPAQKGAPSAGPDAGKAAADGEAAKDGSKAHVLQGEWKVYWIGDDKTTQMNLVNVGQNQQGLTSFVGAFGSISGEACTITGTVIDNLNGQFAEGIEVRTLAILSYVLAKANCAQEQIWIEAFGLPNGKVQMSGRATFVGNDGKRRYAAVALGR